MRGYISTGVAGSVALGLVLVLASCAAGKKSTNAEIVTEGSASSAAAHAVRDGSGKVVSDSAKDCVSTGQAAGGGVNAADCGTGAASATPSAPAPAISEPVAAVAPPTPEPAVKAAEPPKLEPKLEVSKGEVVTAAPKLEELSLQAEAVFTFGNSDGASLMPAAKTRLDELAARVTGASAQTVSKITVTGHADRLGLDAANQSLSRRRAETVQQYLASKGVPAALLQVSAKGESEPIVQCKGDKPTAKLKACLAPNRRVEVVVYGQ